MSKKYILKKLQSLFQQSKKKVYEFNLSTCLIACLWSNSLIHANMFGFSCNWYILLEFIITTAARMPLPQKPSVRTGDDRVHRHSALLWTTSYAPTIHRKTNEVFHIKCQIEFLQCCLPWHVQYWKSSVLYLYVFYMDVQKNSDSLWYTRENYFQCILISLYCFKYIEIYMHH